jgi:dihydroxy-acid dehydratase
VSHQYKTLNQLRSRRWFADTGMRGFAHRQRMQQQGFRREDLMERPIVAILNTWSDLSPCHAHLRERAEAVKRGVLLAGGFPLELPAMSLGEVMVKPTTMLYRNFLAMEVEELLRSLPCDGVVLLAGCDKTTPATVMGAISMDIPTIFCPAGPMLNDRYFKDGVAQTVGAGTHTRIFWDDYQAGKLTAQELQKLESRMTRTPGTCNTMGTASTMTSIVEALGLTLPGASSIPAMDSAHTRMATDCGQTIVEMIWQDLKPSDILTSASFQNAVAVQMALGGSTNAAVHIIAMARRAGVKLTLNDLDICARRIPVIANLFPSGDKLMEDFYYAGGLGALMHVIQEELSCDAMTVNGKTIGENIAFAKVQNDAVIRPLSRPVSKAPALATLKGNLAPMGAVIKPSAASEKLMLHKGPALVFDSPSQMLAAMEDENLACDENTVLVLRNAGPVGAPGMPEWGNLPIPKKLLKVGVRDMLRLSDARMSGTHYGTCVLHISPESAVGGPLALVQTGDFIEINLPARTLHLHVDDSELSLRRAQWRAPECKHTRGYTQLYQAHVTQAHEGCDFDFLEQNGKSPEPAIF